MLTWDHRIVRSYLKAQGKAQSRQNEAIWTFSFADRILHYELEISDPGGRCRLIAGPAPLGIPLMQMEFYCRVIDQIPAIGSKECLGFYISEERTPTNLVLSIFREDEDFFSIYPRTFTHAPTDSRN
jgi:hypothetical protein